MDTRKSDAIYEILLQKGFAESLCREIAYKYMNTDYTAHTNARLFVPHDRAKRRTACRRNDSNLRRQRPNHKKT